MAGNYGAVKSVEDLGKFVEKLKGDAKPFGFDIEAGYDGDYIEKGALQTYHPRWKMVGFSFTNDRNWARYVPLAHDEGGNLDEVECARHLWTLLQTGLAVIANAPYELSGVSRFFRDTLWDDAFYGADVRAKLGAFPVYADSMLMGYAHGLFQFIGLKAMTKEMFGHQMTELIELFPEGTKKKEIRFNVLPVTPTVINYACEDAAWCLAIVEELWPEFEPKPSDTKEQAKSRLGRKRIYNVEMSLLPVLQDMEYRGLVFDWAAIEAAEKKTLAFKELMNEEIQRHLSELTGEVENVLLSSSKQVATVLFEKLNMPVKVRSETTGAPSTGKVAMQGLARDYPVVREILRYRQVGKLLSSYLTKFLRDIRYAEDGRAHPNHNQAGTKTGRFSVDHVSYQQWPKPYHFELESGETFDLNFRDFLLAPPGKRIIGYDFSQVELRVLAGVSEEADMLQAFADNIDIHKQTASTMMKIPLDQVTDKERGKGKTLNFGIVYGQGPEAMGESLGISRDEAAALLEQYFAGFPKLKAWADAQVVHGHETGFVETMFGRRTKIWELESKFNGVRNKGDRLCVNSPIQGGAADYMKFGMVRVWAAMKKAVADGLWRESDVELVMTVHDALEFYVDDSVDTQTFIDVMYPAISLPVQGLPEIRADWHEGIRWGSVSEIELDDQKKITGYTRKLEIVGRDTQKYSEDSWQKIDELVAAYFKENPLDWVDPNKGKDDVPLAFLGDGEDDFDIPDDDVRKLAEKRIATMVNKVYEPEPEGDDEPPWLHAREEVVEPYEVTVTISDMPTQENFLKFKAFISERPGLDTLILKTPQGPMTLPERVKVLPDDQVTLSLIFGAATLTRKSQRVDSAALLKGVDL